MPVLAAFRQWLIVQTGLILPKSPIAVAMGYTLSNWTALGRYVEDGDLLLKTIAGRRVGP